MLVKGVRGEHVKAAEMVTGSLYLCDWFDGLITGVLGKGEDPML